MREIHASKHTTYTLYNKIVDKDTYIKFDFGFSDEWLPAYETYDATKKKYYLWEGKEVAKHQLSISLAALLSKTKQHCRMKSSLQTLDHHY